MSFTVLIPARLASTRLPDKPLADLAGLPMIVHVARRAARSGASSVVVCADHERTLAACRTHGVQAVATRADHATGSDRLAEACERLGLDGDDVVVNVQGDEPLIDPALIDACVECFLGGVYDYVSLGGDFPDGLDTEVVAADLVARTVTTADGEELAYDELVVATGAPAVVPDWALRADGTPYDGVGPVKTLDDGAAWLERFAAVGDGAHVVVVGAGYVGVEVAALCDRDRTVSSLNAGIERNAGYRRSLERDAEVRS
jgi:3-deoxy-manno-octulosonate cytidylyltransferase (CMP-KDO synthetase)